MAKPLSEQLAALSGQAKSAEDAVAAARKEAHDKIVARREQALAAATQAVDKVQQEMKSASDTLTSNWKALQAKVVADVDALNANIVQWKHERDVTRATNRADRLEWEAGLAVDYALASIERAKLAVLDAMLGRMEAEEAKQA